MKTLKLQSLKAFEQLSNEGMKSVKGGYTLNTVTVTPEKPGTGGQFSLSNNSDDGDDGITND